jgi:cobaltochelatase CobS
MKATRFPLGSTFGFSANEIPPSIQIPGYEHPDLDTLQDPKEKAVASFLKGNVPPVDSGYVFRKDLLRELNFWYTQTSGDVLCLWGPTGSGKTSLANQFLARLGVPVFHLKGHKKMELIEAFGHYVAGPNGQTVFNYGPVTQAARCGGVVVINEYDRIQPSTAVAFNDVFEGGEFAIPGKHGETIRPRSGFKIIITANTNLVEDTSGLYQTASTHDISLLERLYSIRVSYPDEEAEKKVVAHALARFDDKLLSYWFDQEGIRVSTKTGEKHGAAISRDEFIQGIIDVAQKIRKQSRDGGNDDDSALERTMSTRIVAKWASYSAGMSGAATHLGISALHYAMTKCLSDFSTESTKIALHQAVTDVFGVAEKLKP